MIAAGGAEYTQLTRNYDIYKQNYDDLLKRRESVTMSGDVESKTDTVDFRVIDPPFVPSKPAWPNRPLLLSLVTLGGLGAGVAVAFLLSQLRRTVTDRRVLRELTGLPLLGAVSRVETDESLRRKRKGLLTYLAALGSLIGCLWCRNDPATACVARGLGETMSIIEKAAGKIGAGAAHPLPRVAPAIPATTPV